VKTEARLAVLVVAGVVIVIVTVIQAIDSLLAREGLTSCVLSILGIGARWVWSVSERR